MATQARTGLVAEWFTPLDQRDTLADPESPESESNPLTVIDRPTRYRLKPLDGMQFAEIMTMGEHGLDGSFIPTHVGRKLTLAYTLKDWENLDHKDKPDKFSLGALHHIPGHHIIECANHIIEVSGPTEDDELKSE